MLLSRHAITDTNLPIRECMIDRTNQVVDLTFKLPNKCGSDSLWPSSHIDGVCSNIQATRLRFHHPSVNREECNPLAFYRNLNLFRSKRAPKDLTFNGIVGHDMEHILPVCRKVMNT